VLSPEPSTDGSVKSPALIPESLRRAVRGFLPSHASRTIHAHLAMMLARTAAGPSRTHSRAPLLAGWAGWEPHKNRKAYHKC